MPTSESSEHVGRPLQGEGPREAAEQAAADRSRLRASEAAFTSGVIEFQLARQRLGAFPAERIPVLSAREREVLALVAAGRSDGEIADTLFIAKKTASVHVANIKGKLGASSRVEIAIFASELGLVDGAPTPDARGLARASRPTVVCPFKGLASYEVADADFFFGRERVVAECVARLAGSTFLGVVGPSGSGKSSVIRAGLVPALASGVLPGSDRWAVAVTRPGAAPLRDLGRAIGVAMRGAGASASTTAGQGVDALDALPADMRLAVVVDQFEESFTLCPDEAERGAFIESLTALAHDRALRALVIVGVRADFYGRCAEYPEFAELLAGSQVLVGPMATVDLARAVESPARVAGLRVEADLTAAIVADVTGQPGGLPLLSTTLLDLWQRRDGRTLRLATYRETGGVSGSVARLAEAAFERLSLDERAIARAIFLRLAMFGGGEAAVRRPTTTAELDAGQDPDVARVLAALTESRLVTVDDDRVELAHEVLLHEWPRLRGWLEEGTEGRRLREHLTKAARDWEAAGMDAAELYRGARLTATLDWAEAHGPELNDLERRFLAESRAASEREAERQRRANRRLRGLLVGAVLLLVAAVGAGALAAAQAGRAEEEARRAEQAAARAAEEADRARAAEALAEREAQIARSRELAQAAAAVIGDDPALSKLLLITAGSIADLSIESTALLHRAFGADAVVDRYTWPVEQHPVGLIHTDLHPSGRYMVATGFWFERPHDYLEAVDLATDRLLWSVDPDVESVAVGNAYFTPGGDRVVFGAYRETARPEGADPARPILGVSIRDALGGAELAHWDTGACGAVLVAVSDTNALVRTSVGDRCIDAAEDARTRKVALEVLDLTSGTRTMLSPSAALTDEGALSVDGRWVAFDELTGSAPGSMLVDLETGRRVSIEAPEPFVRDIDRDGSHVLLGGGESALIVWDAAGGDRVELPESVAVAYAEFTRSDGMVYTSGSDATLRRWDPRTGAALVTWPNILPGRPAAASDGHVLVPHSGEPGAVLVDTRVRGEVGAVARHTGSGSVDSLSGCDIERGRLDVKGTTAVFTESCAGPYHPSVRVIDTQNLEPVRSIDDGLGSGLSPDGTRLALQEVHEDGGSAMVGPIRIVDMAGGGEPIELEGLCAFDAAQLVNAHDPDAHEGCEAFPNPSFPIVAWQIVWSPDGELVAVIDGFDAYFAVWRSSDGALVANSSTLLQPGAKVYDAMFTPDSASLVASHRTDERWSLMRIATGAWTVEGDRPIAADFRRLKLLGFSSDGRSIVTVSEWLGTGTGALHWYDLEGLDEARSVTAIHDGQLGAAAVSGDRSLVATGAADGTIRVWDVDTGRLEHEFSFPGTTVGGVAFVGDRRLGVLLGDDGVFRVMTVDQDELLRVARRSLTRGFSVAECARFTLEPCPALAELRGD